MDIELKGDPNYFLSQTLEAHSSAVRSLSLADGVILSGSTDKIARLFVLSGQRYEPMNQMDFYQSYIYAVCHRVGGGFAVASGNQVLLHDGECNPIGVLEGHAGQVCSLSSGVSTQLVSGSWDGTAIVWDLSSQSVLYRLEGHKYGTAVLALEDEEILSGSQDGVLRYWIKGKQIKTVDAHNDIVREIAAVPNIGYLTCSNDEQIKLWSRDLDHLATFLGHSGFIFSCKPILIMGTQYYVSASDDNTVKVWKGVGELVQTINHPGCVWTVTVNTANGDIVSGCVDGRIRVFTLNPQRKANQEELELYEKEVELAAAQGPQGLSQEQLEKMAPVEQLASIPGKKEGEVKMFRNGNKPEVYAWDGTTWQKLGDVVGGSTKKQFAGDKYFPAGEYDYVFDVDDDSGVPKLIPLNDGDNQLDVAERFCKREGYSKSYLGQVMTFLKKNTKPQEQKKPAPSAQMQASFQCIPYTVPIFYEQINLQGLQKKLVEFNTELLNASDPVAIQPTENYQLNQIIDVLGNQQGYHSSNLESNHVLLIQNKLLKWPTQYMLPVYDFLRLLHLHHSSEKLYSGLQSGLTIFTDMGVHMQQPNQNVVFVRLCLQTLGNLFKQNANVFASLRHMSIVCDIIKSQVIIAHSDDKISQALANLILNYSIAVYQKSTIQPDGGTFLAEVARVYIASRARDSESLAKVVTAIGNLTQCNDPQIRRQAKQVVGATVQQLQINDNADAAKCLQEVKTSLSRV